MEFKEAICAGLSVEPKTIPPKYLYDQTGSQLFEQICQLDEYYPTRTETGILKRFAGEMAEMIGPGALIIEPGSGSAKKVQYLLSRLEKAKGYVPIEISKEILMESAEELKEKFPELPVVPVHADYTESLKIPSKLEKGKGKRVVFFPGSTIGNFDPVDAQAFVKKLHHLAGPNGGLLIGVDLKKDAEVLKRAYDDSKGVTAMFNLNLLMRANRELGADFDVPRFRHEAVYNPEASRVEMHLVSNATQTVVCGDEEFQFRKGETIHTESSYKYTIEHFTTLVEATGFELQRYWTDPQYYFCVFYFTRMEDQL